MGLQPDGRGNNGLRMRHQRIPLYPGPPEGAVGNEGGVTGPSGQAGPQHGSWSQGGRGVAGPRHLQTFGAADTPKPSPSKRQRGRFGFEETAPAANTGPPNRMVSVPAATHECSSPVTITSNVTTPSGRLCPFRTGEACRRPQLRSLVLASPWPDNSNRPLRPCTPNWASAGVPAAAPAVGARRGLHSSLGQDLCP